MEKIRNFILGFSSPTLCMKILPPDYEVFTKLMDGCLLLIFSTISGILVSVLSSLIISTIKARKKKYDE